MKTALQHILLCFLLLSSSFRLGAQELRWDNALARYERICEDCLRLRSLAETGQGVPAEDLHALLQELSSLRKMLRDAEGEMSPRQRDRFRQIRRRYSAVFSGEREPMEALPSGRSIPDPYQMAAFPQRPPRFRPLPVRERRQQPVQWRLMAFCVLPEVSPGLMVTAAKGKLGLYLKGSSSLRWPQVSGTCYSNGTTDGGYVWTSGKACVSRMSVSGGMLFSPWPFLDFYAGAGYGNRQLLWEETGGSWLRVSDLSAQGFCADAGVVISVGHLSILAGVSTICFRTLSADVGLGWRF